MPAVRFHVPKYCLHKARGLAYVRDRGKVRYLGKHGSPESKEAYGRFLVEWQARQADAPLPAPEAADELTVVELCAAYLDYATGYYVKNGRSSGQVPHVRRAIRVTNELYGHTPAADFGPLALESIRDHLVRFEGVHPGNKQPLHYSRTTINLTCEGIRRIFKWGVRKQLLPVTVFQALLTVPGLKAGRTTAREPEPIRPVAGDVVDATLPHLSPVVADMVRFQRLTGCRPGEVCDVRPIDVDRGGAVWQYRPASHKTEHKGRERIIFVGPKAKAILMPYILRAPSPDAYCFSPAESVAQHVAEKRARRRTRVQPSQQNRRKARPQKAPSTHFCKDAYRRAIVRGVAKANRAAVDQAAAAGIDPPQEKIPEWHPNQLRHSAATEIRRQFGLEAAQTVLGHAKADVTQVYAERDYRLAADVMAKIG